MVREAVGLLVAAEPVENGAAQTALRARVLFEVEEQPQFEGGVGEGHMHTLLRRQVHGLPDLLGGLVTGVAVEWCPLLVAPAGLGKDTPGGEGSQGGTGRNPGPASTARYG